MRRAITIAAIAAVGAAFSPVASHATPYSIGDTRVSVTATVNLHSYAGFCDNTGSSLTFDGDIQVDGATFWLLFTNQRTVDAVHQATSDEVTLSDTLGFAGSLRKGGFDGPGGNPYIYIKVPGEYPQYIGRCVQGARLGDVSGSFPVGAVVNAVLSSTANKKGPMITLFANESTDSIEGTAYFTNNRKKFEASWPSLADWDNADFWKHTGDTTASVGFVVSPTLTFSKGFGHSGDDINVTGFAGGNPWIFWSTESNTGEWHGPIGRINDLR